MRYDPNDKNDFGFDEPDWLSELTEETETPAPQPSRPQPRPEPTSPPRPAQPQPQPDWQREDPAPRPAGKPRSQEDWERARTGRRGPARTGGGGKPGRKRRTKVNIPLIVLIVLLVGGLIFAAWQLGSIFLGYSRDRSAYADLAANALSAMAEKEETSNRQPEDIQTQPNTPETPAESEVPFQVDWDYLRTINEDIVGWLYSPGTVINYPVVQSQDHDFYLDHGFDGGSNTTGTLFADRASVSGITQSNYIIYGHNMKDESMFGTFKHYVEKSYYEQHPVLYYMTPNGSYRVELVCARTVEATVDNFPTYFSSTEDQQAYLNDITSSAYWVNYDAVTTEYQLMTLSTCTSASNFRDPRFLVHGIMIPIQ